MARRSVVAGALLAAAGAVLAWYPARAGEARAVAAQVSTADPENVGRLLASVRGASPLFCELAARLVDGRVWWSKTSALSQRPD